MSQPSARVVYGDDESEHLGRRLTADQAGPEHEALLADSVGRALLVVLDTLTPAERVAFVLHDVFAVRFSDIAPILDRSVDATRQLASRARGRVRAPAATLEADRLHQAARVDAFLAAARDGRRALLDGLAAAVWMPGGRLRVVWRFTTGGDRIAAIELIADPARLRQLDLVVDG